MRRLAAVLVLALSACGRPAPDRDEGLRRAAAWLWARQDRDGGWHSTTYGLLKSGQSLTPFVLRALLDVPESLLARPAGGVDRAVEFIRRRLDSEGALGRADPELLDYPNYATALAVQALVRAGRRDDVSRMVACLRNQQFAEHLGWTEDHPAYGAWGMGGPPRRLPIPGHLDLSMTRHVLEALHDAGVASDDPAFRKASVFVKRCQAPDGGFYFSTVVVDGNKAGRDGDSWRSYGTATADGLLSLAAIGQEPARTWLKVHHSPDHVPGFPEIHESNWRQGMFFYYAAAVAKLGFKSDVTTRQQRDGSFRNSSFLMKEDDPLIATGFAVTALAAMR